MCNMYIYLKYQALNTVTIRDEIVHGLCGDQRSSGTEAWLTDNKNEGAKVYQPKLLDYQRIKDPIEARNCRFSRYLKTLLDQCWRILVNNI